MTPDVLNALLALYAASSGVSLAYLSLTDYRYRNSITEYFNYYINRSVRLSEKFIDKEVKPDSVREMMTRAKKRQCEVQSASGKGDDAKIAPWLRFLEELMDMPKGHVPNKPEISFTDGDLENHKTDKKNWLLTKSGWCFRNIFMVHRDNNFVTHLAGLSLFLLAMIISAIVFSAKIQAASPQHVMTGIWCALFLYFLGLSINRAVKKQFTTKGFFIFAGITVCAAIFTYASFSSITAAGVGAGTSLLAASFLGIGLIALTIPAMFAYLGRRVICETARGAIHNAVDSLLSAELNDGISDWVASVENAVAKTKTE